MGMKKYLLRLLSLTERYITINVIIVCPLGKTSRWTTSAGFNVPDGIPSPELVISLKKFVNDKPGSISFIVLKS